MFCLYYMSKAVNKASRMLGLVKATFTCIDLMRQHSPGYSPLYGTASFGIWKCDMVSKVPMWQARSRKKAREKAQNWYQTWDVYHIEIG